MIRIGKYTISEHDKLNLKVTALEKRTIESQMIAGAMNEKQWRDAEDLCQYGLSKDDFLDEFGYKEGDTYEHEEFIGYFPKSKPELAFERVYSLMVSDGISNPHTSRLWGRVMLHITGCREEVIEAVKGVEV